ncbi:MAG TPA: preprotein translocase subunit SecG [Thermodesulfovibrionales bacterium]|nr:preprotein translocase subunit SecG [Thermodesulfovibrionales bacterium]
MTTLLVIIHLLVCLFLIFIVLIQSSKGAELGAAFGGSSQTLFGSRGAATLLSKLTTISAVVFMMTSLLLAMVSVKGGSVVKKTLPIEQKTGGPSQQGPVQSSPIQQQGPVDAPMQKAPAQQAPQKAPAAQTQPAK